MTSYLVLQSMNDEEPGTWLEVGHASAASADQAIRIVAAASELPGSGSQLVAVPARSWKPRTATVETKTAVKLA